MHALVGTTLNDALTLYLRYLYNILTFINEITKWYLHSLLRLVSSLHVGAERIVIAAYA